MAVFSKTSGSLATITFAAKAGIRNRLFQVIPSFDATPVAGMLTVEFDGTEVLRQYRSESTGHPLSFVATDGWAATIGKSLSVILTSGSASVNSALVVEYTGETPS